MISYLQKSVFLLLLCLFSGLAHSSEASAEQKYLGYCSHFGDGVSLSFSSCANSNFSTAARFFNRVSRYCFNSSGGVSYSFTSCVNSNFQTIQSASNGNLYLRYCTNFDRDRLDFSFVSCVNSNFSAISRVLRL